MRDLPKVSTPRRILALLFELAAEDGRIWTLIAWIDARGNSRYLYPAHPDRCLLDVTAGDLLIFKQTKKLTVRRLKPWRTSECRDETAYREIVCGRAWENA